MLLIYSWVSVFELDPKDKPEEGFTAGKQAGNQLAALGVTLVIALVGGAITGFIMKLPIWGAQEGREQSYELPVGNLVRYLAERQVTTPGNLMNSPETLLECKSKVISARIG